MKAAQLEIGVLSQEERGRRKKEGARSQEPEVRRSVLTNMRGSR
ncbi:MAG TPA: hypothetical protein VLA84_01310 [Microcoleus sp.]|nr:hypothetical protein [Microcoleus sp.]